MSYSADVTERARTASYRLAYAVPLTPWPIVLWLQTLPDWSTARHSASALAGISSAVLPMLVLTTGAGLLLVGLGRRTWEDVAVWAVFATIHFFILFEFIASKTQWNS